MEPRPSSSISSPSCAAASPLLSLPPQHHRPHRSIHSAASRTVLPEAQRSRTLLADLLRGIDPTANRKTPSSSSSSAAGAAAAGEERDAATVVRTIPLALGPLQRPHTAMAALGSSSSHSNELFPAQGGGRLTAGGGDHPPRSQQQPQQQQQQLGPAPKRPLSVTDIMRRRAQWTSWGSASPVYPYQIEEQLEKQRRQEEEEREQAKRLEEEEESAAKKKGKRRRGTNVQDDAADSSSEEDDEEEEPHHHQHNHTRSTLQQQQLFQSPMEAARLRRLAAKEELETLKLEIERSELEDQLKELTAKRRQLSAVKEVREHQQRVAAAVSGCYAAPEAPSEAAEAYSNQSVAVKRQHEVAALRDNDMFLKRDMADGYAEYYANRDKRRQEALADADRRRQLNTKARPTSSAIWGSSVLLAEEEERKRHAELHRKRRNDTILVAWNTNEPLSPVSLTKSKPLLRTCTVEEQQELLTMRTIALDRLQDVTEPNARHALEQLWVVGLEAAQSLVVEGWMMESRNRRLAQSEEAHAWKSLVSQHEAVWHRLQVAQWAPTVLADQPRRMVDHRQEDEVAPLRTTAMLAAMKEQEREATRAIWKKNHERRRELLDLQRRRRNLKEEQRRLQKLLSSCEGTNLDDDETSSTSSPPASSMNHDFSHTTQKKVVLEKKGVLYTQRQRLEYLVLQLADLEADETALKDLIAKNDLITW